MRIAIVGGGPSALFMCKALVRTGRADLRITVFESQDRIGSGMPYGPEGANSEHVTNVSGNEIPPLVVPIVEWLSGLPDDVLESYRIERSRITDYKVLPRLLFGEYLSSQFVRYREEGASRGIVTDYVICTTVTDIRDDEMSRTVTIVSSRGVEQKFDAVIICTGHQWPREHETRTPGYFDSPYPPQKIVRQFPHPVAIRGTSLTAIDAIRTLSRANGEFARIDSHTLSYRVKPGCEPFRIVLHSREGFLPGIRFHLEDPHLSKSGTLPEEALQRHIEENDGFASLDYLFEQNFKLIFRDEEPTFYEFIKHMNLETFVCAMMRERERSDPFAYFKKEYADAQQSIRRHESIYWKEKLAILSATLNYPAKYLSAEDRIRLQDVLMPLVSVVIAFAPQSSCEELIALHEAGRIELVTVGADSRVTPREGGGAEYRYGEGKAPRMFETFIDCVGQRSLSFEQFPFPSLKNSGAVSPATLPFRSSREAKRIQKERPESIVTDACERLLLRVPGVAIGDSFEAISVNGRASDRLYVMAVPLIGGYNPDYSGLDFCEGASKRIASHIFDRKT